MDGQEYLNQISASVRPVKQKKGVGGFSGVFGSIYFKLGVVALIILIITVIIGSILGSLPTAEEKTIDLKLRIDNTSGVITEYQPSVKSSLLRSLSASLKGVLTNTSTQLDNYMAQAYGYSDDSIKETAREAAELNKDSLINELFEAKINGLLDRVYAHKMSLEVYGIMSDESSIFTATSDETLKSLLSNSYDSLNNLYKELNDFSETK